MKRAAPWLAAAAPLVAVLACQSKGATGESQPPGSPTVAAQGQSGPESPPGAGARGPADAAVGEVVETIYDGGLKNWQDWGWAKREVPGSGPAKIDFSNWGGWILANPGNSALDFGSLVFRVKAPGGNADFLEVHLVGPGGDLPPVHVESQHRSPLGGALAGWEQVEVPFADLDPDGVPFDRVVFHAARSTSGGWTLIDKIALTKRQPGAPRPSPSAAYANAPHRRVDLSVACGSAATKISPYIYGIAYSHMDSGEHQWKMGATIRRWGGNNMSRYNWQISALNLDSDWFFENGTVPPYTKFLADDAAHGVASTLTVPMIGWVAKDATSVGFPVSVFGPQANTDPSKPEAGNGVTKGGKEIHPGPPTQTSVAASPEFIGRWVQAIREDDARTGKRSVQQYILDNEPALWNHTHRDVRPEPLTYDELVQRTIDYGTAVRRADPDAVIAGFAEWGWPNYIYSAKDAENNWAKADRKAHGDVPLIEYYLRKLREYEQRTGIRVIDVVDIHFYPAFGEGTHYTEDQADPIRIRSVRSLWDPEYVDESWIKEKIRILPRMKEWIAANYPGRGISIGEWNYGGERRMSGGLATAEALGRYAQFGVTSAYYWTFPPANSPPMLAFLAYRNFDGKGGRFQDWYVPSTAGTGPVTLFASRDEEGKHLVAILINASSEFVADARLDLSACGPLASRQEFTLTKGMRAIAPGAASTAPEPVVPEVLPPYSITVVDVKLADAMKGGLSR